MTDHKNYTTCYIVRHGETDWNVERRIQGHTDIPLNATGEIQAKELAETLKNVHFDAIFSSDLLRAYRTAEIVAIERSLAVQTTVNLRERKFGHIEGTLSDSQEAIRTFEMLAQKQAIEGYESDDMFIARLLTFIREIAIAYPSKTILMVSHGGTIRVLLEHLGYFKEESFHGMRITNTGYITVQTDGIDFFITETVGISHL